MKKNFIIILLLASAYIPLVFAEDISLTGIPESPLQNLEQLDKFLTDSFPGLERQVDFNRGGGRWMLPVGSNGVIVIADEKHNRVRVMAPILVIDPGDTKFLLKLLQANFGNALDARYAINQGYLWALFLHPLGDCRPSQLKDAIGQVLTLVHNTGTTFASSNLIFGGGP